MHATLRAIDGYPELLHLHLYPDPEESMYPHRWDIPIMVPICWNPDGTALPIGKTLSLIQAPDQLSGLIQLQPVDTLPQEVALALRRPEYLTAAVSLIHGRHRGQPHQLLAISLLYAAAHAPR